MDVFKSNKYKECFKKLPPLIKSKIIKIIKQLKKSLLRVELVKGYNDTYRCRIDDDYFFVFLLDGQSCILLFAGKNEEDFTK